MERHPRIFSHGSTQICLGDCPHQRRQSPDGQTLIEVAAALGVAVIIVAALVSLGISAMRSSNFSKNKAVAIQVANEALEAMRARRDDPSTDFNSFFVDGECYALTGGRIAIAGGSCDFTEMHPRYSDIKYVIRVANVDGTVAGREVIVIVRFTDSAGDHDTSPVSTILTDWR